MLREIFLMLWCTFRFHRKNYRLVLPVRMYYFFFWIKSVIINSNFPWYLEETNQNHCEKPWIFWWNKKFRNHPKYFPSSSSSFESTFRRRRFIDKKFDGNFHITFWNIPRSEQVSRTHWISYKLFFRAVDIPEFSVKSGRPINDGQP